MLFRKVTSLKNFLYSKSYSEKITVLEKVTVLKKELLIKSSCSEEIAAPKK